MNDEIKEILDYLKNNTFIPDETKRKYKILHKDETKRLLDYITNLQQENEYLKQQPCFEIEHTDTFAYKKWKCSEVMKQAEELEDYKSRCEKAIEYCKSYSCWEDEDGTFHETNLCIDDLLNILQNGSDSQ